MNILIDDKIKEKENDENDISNNINGPIEQKEEKIKEKPK